MRLIVMPVVLTTVTIIATFLLSTVTNIVSIRNFGMFMSIGLGVALLISLLLTPAWIALFGRDAKQQVGTLH
jgi:predicted RND superfamily exporter protein